MTVTKAQPNIAIIGDELVIRVPRSALASIQELAGPQIASHEEAEQMPLGAGLEALRGSLADVPEFQGKTSVEVQHMIGAIWARKYIS